MSFCFSDGASKELGSKHPCVSCAKVNELTKDLPVDNTEFDQMVMKSLVIPLANFQGDHPHPHQANEEFRSPIDTYNYLSELTGTVTRGTVTIGNTHTFSSTCNN